MILNKLAAILGRRRACLSSLRILLAAVVLFGCSKAGPGKSISASAFDSGPADLKQLWSEGLAAWKTHRYAEAATSFVTLQAKTNGLSSQQTEELTKAVEEFGQEAFAAANKGDAGATEGVKILRGSGRRSAPGR
jgi:hypothetical protein